MSLAGIWDLTIEQGATFTRYFLVEDNTGAAKDLSSYSLRVEIRTARKPGTMLATSVGGSATIDIEFVVDGSNGRFYITMTPTNTAALSFVKGAYDIEAYTAADADVLRLFQGGVTLNKECAY